MKNSVKSHRKMALSRYNLDYIPSNIGGVYAFWYRVNGRCVYVGMATNIKERLRTHWRNSHNKKLKQWIRAFGGSMDICYLPVNYGRIRRVERRLIKMWRPETNNETIKLNQQE